MSELGGFELDGGAEGVSGASEQLSEQAKEQFAENLRAIKQLRKQERKSRKKDDAVAQIIIQFLGNKQYAHLFVLISRLVARNCSSVFILSILSLIHAEAKLAVEQYLADQYQKTAEQLTAESTNLANTQTDNAIILEWITRIQMVLSLDSEAILRSLMIDEANIDGTLLQLSTFIVQEFYKSQQRPVPFEQVQPLTANLLQSVVAPYLVVVQKKILAERAAAAQAESDE